MSKIEPIGESFVRNVFIQPQHRTTTETTMKRLDRVELYDPNYQGKLYSEKDVKALESELSEVTEIAKQAVKICRTIKHELKYHTRILTSSSPPLPLNDYWRWSDVGYMG